MKTVSFEVQIMSKEKYPSMFQRQMAAVVRVYHPSNTFFATRAVLKLGEYHSDIPQF